MTTRILIDPRIEALVSESEASVVLRERTSLDRLLQSTDGRVVIVGAGSTGKRTVAALRSIGIEPLALADNNQEIQGASIDGLSVLRPSDAASQFGSEALFIVAIWNAKHWYSETAAQLDALGCKNVVPVSSVYWRFAEMFLPFFCEDLPHKTLFERDDILRASALWSDEQSRSEYLAHVRWRTHGDFAGLPRRPPEESYFAEDIFELSSGESFVDCGAFDGDTLRSFILRRDADFRHFDAIEPSAETCRLLRNYVSQLSPPQRDKIAIHQCAVGAASGSVRFDATAGLDSHISEHGSVVVDLRTLDAICRETAPTFLKMDIEGAEYEALLGARQVIQTFRPILAICAYHTQNDLWRLPLLIKDMHPGYRMYLRTYEGDGWQAVVYAVPPERLRLT